MAPRRDTSQASRGCWKGSTVTAGAIQALVRARKMPAEVQWRAPSAEVVPSARAGERVVFLSHFERGFGLPASTFFRDFLNFHRLQPHHLAANFIMLLSGFVTLCEGYLGCQPSLTLWKRLFNLRAHSAQTGASTTHPHTGKVLYETVMTDCGSCIATGSKHGYKSPDIIQSCKDWQTSFFYVRSPDNGPDMLNLPEFSLDRPLEKYQWDCKIGVGDQDIDSQAARVAKLFADGMQPYDLVASWLDVRVLPLQRRVHIICDMSGNRDPTRICTKKMSPEELVTR